MANERGDFSVGRVGLEPRLTAWDAIGDLEDDNKIEMAGSACHLENSRSLSADFRLIERREASKNSRERKFRKET